jgi:protein-tyrosine phosphatase
LPITLHTGAELVIDPDLPRQVIEDKRMTIGGLGRHVLFEMPMMGIPIYAHSACFELLTLGVTPIWAHPERCLDVINNPGIVMGFIKSGVLLQFNTNSILGNYGSNVKKTVRHLLEQRVGNILASDTHRIETIKTLPDAMKKLVNTVGKDKAIDMAYNTPSSLLS